MGSLIFYSPCSSASAGSTSKVKIVAGPGRQPGGFLYWPKESHQRKCLMALRSAFLLPVF
jgi:hypothetical protein